MANDQLHSVPTAFQRVAARSIRISRQKRPSAVESALEHILNKGTATIRVKNFQPVSSLTDLQNFKRKQPQHESADINDGTSDLEQDYPPLGGSDKDSSPQTMKHVDSASSFLGQPSPEEQVDSYFVPEYRYMFYNFAQIIFV